MRLLFLLVSFFAVNPALIAQSKKKFSGGAEPKVLQTAFKKDTFNIVKYGAKSDGIFFKHGSN